MVKPKKQKKFQKNSKKFSNKMDYSQLSSKQLTQICKERQIKYAAKMRKQEKIEILSQNDQDPSKIIHSEAKKRTTDYTNNYRDNEEQREKARECSRRWRKNNPEKAREYWLQWMAHIENEKIQQEKELAESWRENNPEKDKQYWEKWIEQIEKEIQREPTNYWEKNLGKIMG